MAKLRSIYTEHAFIDLVFEHIASVFFIHKLFHTWSAQSLVPEGGVLLTLLGFLKCDIIGIRCDFCSCCYLFGLLKIDNA